MGSKKRKISWIGYGLRALNWLAIISIIIAYFSQYISPNTIWFPAFFGLAYPIIFLINLYFVFHWLLFRRWFVIYPIIAIVLGFSLPAKYIGFGSNVEYTDKDNTLKIMTYNVHDFDYYSRTYSQGNEALNLIFEPEIAGKWLVRCQLINVYGKSMSFLPNNQVFNLLYF